MKFGRLDAVQFLSLLNDTGIPEVVTRSRCGNDSALTVGSKGSAPKPTLTDRSFSVDLTGLPSTQQLLHSSRQLL